MSRKKKIKKPLKERLLKAVFVFCFVFVFISIVVVTFENTIRDADFSGIKNIFGIYNSLNEGVDESTLISNPIMTEEELKSNNGGIINLFVEDKLSLDYMSANKKVVLKDSAIGRIVAKYFESISVLEGVVLKELSILQCSSNYYEIRSVVMVDCDNVIADMLLTTKSVISPTRSIMSSCAVINNFDEEQNTILINELKNLFGDKTDINNFVTTKILQSLRTMESRLGMTFYFDSRGVIFE